MSLEEDCSRVVALGWRGGKMQREEGREGTAEQGGGATTLRGIQWRVDTHAHTVSRRSPEEGPGENQKAAPQVAALLGQAHGSHVASAQHACVHRMERSGRRRQGPCWRHTSTECQCNRHASDSPFIMALTWLSLRASLFSWENSSSSNVCSS